MHVLVLGGAPDERRRAARSALPATHSILVGDSTTLPFVRPRDVPLPPGPRVLLLDDIDRAFPDAQTNGTRLVLTQSAYLLQTWIDRLEEADWVVATADRAALDVNAPEALRRRGAWRLFELVDLGNSARRVETDGTESNSSSVPSVSSVSSTRLSEHLARAFVLGEPVERMQLCREAVTLETESAIAQLALASVCREMNNATDARTALDRAIALAPDFAAAHYESAKLWLAWDDLARARDGFQRAADLMPRFTSAYINLGATLGELDQPVAALAAFEQALALDPANHPLLNNIGVVSRELGALARSEAALRRVVELAPDFVFGHYNLGHTLFLAGRYGEAFRAYEQGHRLDPQKNRRQACRMAIARLAGGDAAGAERDLWRAVNGAPDDEREELLLEAYEITHAWLQAQPEAGDAGGRAFLDRVGSEIVKSE